MTPTKSIFFPLHPPVQQIQQLAQHTHTFAHPSQQIPFTVFFPSTNFFSFPPFLPSYTLNRQKKRKQLLQIVLHVARHCRVHWKDYQQRQSGTVLFLSRKQQIEKHSIWWPFSTCVPTTTTTMILYHHRMVMIYLDSFLFTFVIVAGPELIERWNSSTPTKKSKD